jgi:hypothetical protein
VADRRDADNRRGAALSTLKEELFTQGFKRFVGCLHRVINQDHNDRKQIVLVRLQVIWRARRNLFYIQLAGLNQAKSYS